jgi:hypothetical protein
MHLTTSLKHPTSVTTVRQVFKQSNKEQQRTIIHSKECSLEKQSLARKGVKNENRLHCTHTHIHTHTNNQTDTHTTSAPPLRTHVPPHTHTHTRHVMTRHDKPHVYKTMTGKTSSLCDAVLPCLSLPSIS